MLISAQTNFSPRTPFLPLPMRFSFCLIGFFLLFDAASPRLFAQKKVPPEYLFPIKPGKRNLLSGTMAELRANHFHGGIDIKTDGKEGLPVYATAEGYLCRLKVSSFGYGKVLYLKHKDGKTSVYAHLRNFRDDIENFALKTHYALKSFEIDVNPDKNKFKIKQGDIIAYSGNSGSSGGPHLHFEIRNRQNAPINPLHFGFKEVIDTISPEIDSVALQCRTLSARIEGEQGRKTFAVHKKGEAYETEKTISAHGWLGLEFKGIDRANDTRNKYGINRAVLSVNGVQIYQHTLDAIPFRLNRAMHVFTHYPSWALHRKKFQRAYMGKGNRLPIFPNTQTPEKRNQNGFFYIEDGKLYTLVLQLYDSHENYSVIRLKIRGKKNQKPEAEKQNRAKTKTNIEVTENILKIESPQNADSISLLFGYFQHKIGKAYQKTYQKRETSIFLWDLRKGIPQYLRIGKQKIPTNLVVQIPSEQKFVLYQKNLRLLFSEETLFDTLFLQIRCAGKKLHLQTRETPLFRPLTVSWYPPIADDTAFAHKKVYRLGRKGQAVYVGGEWGGKEITFSTRQFGTFFLGEDKTPPEIKLLQKDKESLTFEAEDEKSGIESYQATLNGDWILMTYDHKKKQLRTKLGGPHKALKGKFELQVTDKSGNVASHSLTL